MGVMRKQSETPEIGGTGSAEDNRERDLWYRSLRAPPKHSLSSFHLSILELNSCPDITTLEWMKTGDSCGIIIVPACFSYLRLRKINVNVRLGLQRMRHRETSQRWSMHLCPRLSSSESRGMSLRAWEPRLAQPEQESTLEGVGDVNHPSLTPAPTLGPTRVAVPTVAPILAPPHPVGHTTTEHFPEMNPPLAPEDLPRPQSTWLPRAPSPAGGSAVRPLNARLPGRVAARRKRGGRRRRGLKLQCSFPPSIPPTKKTLLGFHPPFCVFHCS